MMKWLVLIIAVEALTEILLHGYPTEPVRRLAGKWAFTRELFSCGWCLSVWVAALVFGLYLAGWWIVLIPFALHRLSNYVHAGYELVRSVARRQ